MTKVKKKLLTELKQLKIRQRCIEKNIICSIKLEDLDDLELEFLKSVEKLKAENEKDYRIAGNESKTVVQECVLKVHQFQRNILQFDVNLTNISPGSNNSSPRSNLLNIMAEINVLLSENLYICNQELSSLKFQNN
ncbi:unnamed protein product [Diamesa tonsa]